MKDDLSGFVDQGRVIQFDPPPDGSYNRATIAQEERHHLQGQREILPQRSGVLSRARTAACAASPTVSTGRITTGTRRFPAAGAADISRTRPATGGARFLEMMMNHPGAKSPAWSESSSARICESTSHPFSRISSSSKARGATCRDRFSRATNVWQPIH